MRIGTREALVCVVVLLGTSSAEGQHAYIPQREQATNPYATATAPTTGRPAARFGIGLYDARPQQQQKPYDHLQRTPTISPYLNLERDDNSASVATNYHTLVRPQLQQQATNRRQQRELQQLGRELQHYEAQLPTAPGGSDSIRSTGHSVRFLNYLQFYGQPE